MYMVLATLSGDDGKQPLLAERAPFPFSHGTHQHAARVRKFSHAARVLAQRAGAGKAQGTITMVLSTANTTKMAHCNTAVMGLTPITMGLLQNGLS